MGHEGIRRPLRYGEPTLKRLHRRIFRLNDKIDAIAREQRLVEAELEYHRSINEDAQRDAAVGNYIDREEAGLTSRDVKRFEATLEMLRSRRSRYETKRDALLSRLPD